MLLLILFISIVAVAIWIFVRSKDEESPGAFICFVIGVIGIFGVCIAWAKRSYEYNRFVAKREAFVSTLEAARASGRELEAASIARDVADWNKELAEFKYDRSLPVIGEFTDARFLDLKPIK